MQIYANNDTNNATNSVVFIVWLPLDDIHRLANVSFKIVAC